MTAAILSQIQKDAFAWQLKNFGKPNGLLMIAGMAEEFGESQEHAADADLFLDGVSDCAIYCMQLCSVCEWNIGELWDARDLYEMPSRPWPILLGRISHHYVKGRVSRYRGTQQEHDVRCRAAISGLLKYWDVLLSGMGHDVVAAIEKTWADVSQRDWTKERPAPGGTSESAWPLLSLSLIATQGMQCGDTIVTTKNGFSRFSTSDQKKLAELTSKQHVDRVALVEHLVEKRQAPTGDVVRGLAAVIDAIGDSDLPTKDGAK